MSNTPIFADNSIPPEGRRAKMRQPLGALAYLDILPDNGGIILNLSEDGLAVQAVAPLHGQKHVQIVMQLPHSETRVETAAEIVWVGSSSRQAGVRFLNMPAEARMQIREWIESQTAPLVDATPTVPGPAAIAEHAIPSLPSNEDSSAASRQQKWLSLIAELETDLKPKEEPPMAPAESSPAPVPASASAISDVPVAVPRPEILPWPSAPRPANKPESVAEPAPAGELSDVPAIAKKPTKQPPSLRRPDSYIVVSSDSGMSARSSIRTREPKQAPANSDNSSGKSFQDTNAPGSDFTLFRLAVTTGGGQASTEGARTEPAEKSARASLVKQTAFVAAFALFAVLCFAIGTWVGRLRTSNADWKALPAVSAATKSGAPSAGADAERKPRANEADATPADSRENRFRSRSSGIEKTSLREPDQHAGASLNVAQSSIQHPVLPAPTSAAGDAGILPPSVSSNDAVADVPRAEADRIAQPAPIAPLPEEAAPQVVDGYVLRPSDRFLPCHLTYRVDPVYPAAAQQQRIEGSVKIHLVIGPDGAVRSEKVISGPPELVSAALEAAKYWRYLPALLNGQAVPTEKDVDIDFHLPH